MTTTRRHVRGITKLVSTLPITVLFLMTIPRPLPAQINRSRSAPVTAGLDQGA